VRYPHSAYTPASWIVRFPEFLKSEIKVNFLSSRYAAVQMMTSIRALGFLAIGLGLVGLVVHGSLATALTPVLYNHYSALWVTGMLALAGIELVATERALASARPAAATRHRLSLAYYSTVAICAAVMAITYAVDKRFDIFAWGILHELVAVAGLVQVKQQPADTHEPTASSDPAKVLEQGAATKPSALGQVVISRGRCEVCLHHFARAAHAIVMLLLAAGAGVCAYAATALPPTGSLVSFSVDGQKVSINVKCVDPPAGTPIPPHVSGRAPSLWLTSSPAHGLTGDFIGLQHFLVRQGYRTCAFDPAGFGNSPRVSPRTINVEFYLAQLIEAVERPGAEIAFVASGGGGSAAVALAAASAEREREGSARALPFSVRAVVFVEVFSPGIEWDWEQRERGWTSDERAAFRAADLRSRLRLVQLILGLASPWALMPVFIPLGPPPAEYYPQDRYDEIRIAGWRPQLWVNQYWGLREIAAGRDDDDALVSAAPLDGRVKLGHVLCAKVGERPCERAWGTLAGAECASAKERDRWYRGQQEAMTKKLQPDSGSRVFVYDGAEYCSIGVVSDYPERTARNIATALGELL
jgi:pimeloyl-ACP methyl ester carboxylesterase